MSIWLPHLHNQLVINSSSSCLHRKYYIIILITSNQPIWLFPRVSLFPSPLLLLTAASLRLLSFLAQRRPSTTATLYMHPALARRPLVSTGPQSNPPATFSSGSSSWFWPRSQSHPRCCGPSSNCLFQGPVGSRHIRRAACMCAATSHTQSFQRRATHPRTSPRCALCEERAYAFAPTARSR